jgi:transmembrane sensor
MIANNPAMSRDPEFDDSGRPQSTDPVAQAAAEWVARLDRGLIPEEVATLAEWLGADPRHAAEYTRISCSWQELDVIGAAPELVAMADAVEAHAKARRARRRAWAAAAGLAAAAAIVVGLALWQIPRAVRTPGLAGPATKNYVVLASTARHMALPDGSVAELNGDSRIETDFTPAERRVRLVKGEAHFNVAKDPARPFIVSAGPVTVRATGTAFNVRLAADFVEILVTEGKVQLGESAPTSEQRPRPEGSLDLASAGQALIAGERAVVQTAAAARVPVTVDTPSPNQIDQTLAWEGTQLVFDRTSLDQVVAAFNHYNSRQLVLANPALRNRTLSGVFRADNLEGFIRLLRASVDVIAEPQDGNRIILQAAP